MPHSAAEINLMKDSCLTGNELRLVVHYNLEEGSGNTTQQYIIEVRNVLGQQISTTTVGGNGTHLMNLGNVETGLYLVVIHLQDQQIIQRVIIE